MNSLANEIVWSDGAGKDLTLAEGECHLWELRPSHDYAVLLSSAELRRYQNITSEEVRISFATSQGGLRTLVARYRNCEPGQVRLERGEQGKPYVADGPHFNLSHSAGRILAAFSSQPLGLDLEALSRRVNARALAARFFSPSEAAHVRSLDDAQARGVFLRYWVGKEATVKLSGDGIYHGLRDARVVWGEGTTSHGEYRGRKVWLREYDLGENLLGALASWKPVEAKGFFRI